MNKRRQISLSMNTAKKFRPLPFVEGKHYVVNPETGCWEWTLPYKTKYPHWRGAAVHQLSYAIAFNDTGFRNICHKCDNKRCINPNHLYDGTHRDNMRDKTYISCENALACFICMRNGMSPKDIARTLNLNVSMVKSVIYGKHWITGTDEYRKKLSEILMNDPLT